MLNKVLQAAPLIVYSIGLGAFFLTGEKLYLIFTIGVFFFGSILNKLFKNITQTYFGNFKILQRPNPPKTGCGMFDDCTFPGSRSFGFPSGHAQIVAFAATFWSLYFWHTQRDMARGIILFLLALLVGYSRIENGCHNTLQVAGGYLFGITFGALYFFLNTKL